MTFFFLCTGQRPDVGASRQVNWNDLVRREVTKQPFATWKSLPERVARLILGSTRYEQSERLDTLQIATELDRLILCATKSTEISDADLWAEELLCRAFGPRDYQWDTNYLSGKKTLTSGLRVEIKGNELLQQVDLQLTWESSGNEERKNIDRYLPQKGSKCVSELKAGHWVAHLQSGPVREILVSASIPIDTLRHNVEKAVQSLNKANLVLQF
jgi:hypothetical protein